MTLDIPPGATVQIFIGGPPAQFAAFPAAGEPAALPPLAAPARGRPLLKFAAVGMLVGAAFLGGQAMRPGNGLRLAGAGASTPPAYDRALQEALRSAPSLYPAERERPAEAFEQALRQTRAVSSSPDAPAQPNSQIPPDFARQLQQPPTITPPPGAKLDASPAQAAASGPSAPHPFGLED